MLVQWHEIGSTIRVLTFANYVFRKHEDKLWNWRLKHLWILTKIKICKNQIKIKYATRNTQLLYYTSSNCWGKSVVQVGSAQAIGHQALHSPVYFQAAEQMQSIHKILYPMNKFSGLNSNLDYIHLASTGPQLCLLPVIMGRKHSATSLAQRTWEAASVSF